MAAIDLSNPDAWDDSALIRSWNEALDEYKRYHSIHARGEKVEDVLDQHELAQLRKESQLQRNGGSKHEESTGEHATVEGEEDADAGAGAEYQSGHPAEQHTSSTNDTVAPGANIAATMPNMASMPQTMLGSVQDEALKNLMMSWYYAGYYTGLYEGQSRATQASNAGSSGS